MSFPIKSRCVLTELKGRPPDLLEEREHEISLTYYAEIKFPEALRAKAIYPLFDLQDFSTTLVLCSVPDHSLRLHSALTGELIGAYPFVHTTTEAYISPHSLVFADSGRSFVGGSNNLLATFDISRPGEGPTNLFTTAPSRKRSKAANATALKGIVSALSIERSSNILAAGTFSRHIGLYDAAGKGESLGVFRVNGNEADCSIGGKGVTQLMWSPCGRYLYIVERQSCGIMVYDIRKSGQLLSWVKGRNAETNQRLGCDLSSSPHGGGVLELWAGGVDGNIRVWKDTHHREGPQEPDLVWNVHNGKLSRWCLEA